MVSCFLLNTFCGFGFTPRDGTEGQRSGAESILSPLTRALAGVDGACAAGRGGRAGCVHVMGALGGRGVRRITVSSQFCVFPTCFLNLSHSSLLEPPQDIQSTEPSNFSLSIISFLTSFYSFSSVQFSRSVVSDSLRPMDCSTPDLPVHHQLPELTQTHVH